ncbi:hypothetical protein M422DRAFT_26656 [Sphaerobolus stellatus SS14]|nr:hypothetical protein M422DRAFT_26656 [Sphaerobolus stellatus SS14]
MVRIHTNSTQYFGIPHSMELLVVFRRFLSPVINPCFFSWLGGFYFYFYFYFYFCLSRISPL